MRVIGLLLRGAIRGYQLLISPVLPGQSCRFLPTCSHYGMEAIAVHGPWKGSWLTLRRLLRCHPWGGEGYDPVPPAAVPAAHGAKAAKTSNGAEAAKTSHAPDRGCCHPGLH